MKQIEKDVDGNVSESFGIGAGKTLSINGDLDGTPTGGELDLSGLDELILPAATTGFTTGSQILMGDGASGIANVTIGYGISFSGGTLSSLLVGPVSSTANAIVRWLGIGGTAFKDSGMTISDVSGGSITMSTGTNTALTISTLDSNKNITLSPHGTGTLISTKSFIPSGLSLNLGSSSAAWQTLYVSLISAPTDVFFARKPVPVGDLDFGTVSSPWAEAFMETISAPSGNLKINSTILPQGTLNLGSNSNTWDELWVNTISSSSGAVIVTNTFIPVGSINLGSGSNQWQELFVGDVTASGSIKSAAPSGGTSDTWRLGSYRTDGVGLTVQTTKYAELQIGGSAIKVAVVE